MNKVLEIKLIQSNDTRTISVHDILDFGKYRDCSIKELLNGDIIERGYVVNFLHDVVGLKFDQSIDIEAIKCKVKSVNKFKRESIGFVDSECLNG